MEKTVENVQLLLTELFKGTDKKVPSAKLLAKLMEKHFLTNSDATIIFNCCRKTILRWRKSGKLPYILIFGRVVRYMWVDIFDSLIIQIKEKNMPNQTRKKFLIPRPDNFPPDSPGLQN